MYKDRYVRETKGDRHICSKCKAKRQQRFMRETGRISRFAFPEWECADGFCGSAGEKRQSPYW